MTISMHLNNTGEKITCIKASKEQFEKMCEKLEKVKNGQKKCCLTSASIGTIFLFAICLSCLLTAFLTINSDEHATFLLSSVLIATACLGMQFILK